MTARLIDGNALAKSIRAEVAQRVQALAERGHRPGLAVILVGDNPASQVYVKHKVADCEGVGMHSVLDRHPASLPEAELLARIRALNEDPAIDGILVQLPLPPHIDAQGGHRDHLAGQGRRRLPRRERRRADDRPARLQGLHALRLHEDARGDRLRTQGQTRGRDRPQQHRRQADGDAAPAGQRDRHHLPQRDAGPGAPRAAGRHRGRRGGQAQCRDRRHGQARCGVIDVGMNRNDDGKLCGDVDFAGVSQVAGWITPVPGGVGPMTRAMLLVNTIESAERAHAAR